MYAVRFGEFLFCPLWVYLVGGLWFGRVPHMSLLKPEKYRVSTGKILLLTSRLLGNFSDSLQTDPPHGMSPLGVTAASAVMMGERWQTRSAGESSAPQTL